jgi:Sulfatase-modifying factor enzyme 1
MKRLPRSLIALGWVAAAGIPACAISFGGYELDTGDGGSGTAVGTAGVGGSSAQGSGGAGQGGTGASGSAQGGNGGLAQGGNGGLAQGGSGPGPGGAGGAGGSSGGATGGSSGGGGRDGGATGGVGGVGGTGGSAGKGGASGAGGSPADAGDASTDGGARGCPLLPGPQLIEVPLPAGAPGAPGTYCVDQTEVTNKQYADFLATNPTTAGQAAVCSWNADFSPASMTNPENCPNVSLVYDPVGHPNFPVACIDWCDAAAYCKSVGKHLCRSFAGADLPTNKTADATSDEWYTACSVAGANKFSYGNTYQASYCNMDLFGSSSSIQVGTAPACHGPSLPYSYLYDMNGNVAEWQAACSGTAGMADTCAARGGSWLSSNSPDPTRAGDCVAAPASARSRRSSQIGFRCCYDRK